MNRREFLATSSIAGVSLKAAEPEGKALGTAELLGTLERETGEAPVAGAQWDVARHVNDGISMKFPAGSLSGMRFISSMMLLDGETLAVFVMTLREGESGRAFTFRFGALNQCSFLMRLNLALVDQSRWQSGREGAFLKPMCGGDRVDLRLVDRLTLAVNSKGPAPVRWCMTELRASAGDVPRLENPVLPKGALIDELGQSRLRHWQGKSKSVDEVVERVKRQAETAPAAKWPDSFTQWGGWKEKKLGERSGYFRVVQEGGRWWLADPDGYAFWSAGLDCVRVDCDARFDGIEKALSWVPNQTEYPGTVLERRVGEDSGKYANYLAANMIRAFGKEGWREQWLQVALAEMRRMRFNTVGNWSDWEPVRKAKFPYVRPLQFRARGSGMIYRDFPDVFHPAFSADAAELAGQLKSTAGDPALIGYFLMNEPEWGFSSELPAAGMLYSTEKCASREQLVQWLKRKYSEEADFQDAWGADATYEKVAVGRWSGTFNKAALQDLKEFSSILVELYFQTLTRECRKVDEDHLNLGMRWAGLPPDWAVSGMRSFDVFSLNCYQPQLPMDRSEKIEQVLKMPVMVGEYHFGALDVGLPAPGLVHVRNQEDRGKAYRVYLESAAQNPNCVGAHWFTLYDESALGRYDGENWNIGFLDTCNRPYDELAKAAAASHERMYEVAAGRVKPYSDPPEYLPKLSL